MCIVREFNLVSDFCKFLLATTDSERYGNTMGTFLSTRRICITHDHVRRPMHATSDIYPARYWLFGLYVATPPQTNLKIIATEKKYC